MNTKLVNQCLSRRKHIFNYFLRMTGRDYDLSQDLTQQTFLKIITFFDKYKVNEKEYLNTWMIKVAKHILYDHLRKQKYVLQADIEKDDCDIIYYDGLISETNIEKNYQTKELEEAIEEILSLLPPNQRELFDILKMHDIDGLEYKEISKITGRSNDSLRQGSIRIKKILRNKLSEALQN
jgi:RNA polymerase sigma-70 factor (ECF subfamily)